MTRRVRRQYQIHGAIEQQANVRTSPMKDTPIAAGLVTLLLCSSSALAGWKGEAEAGFTSTRGNTETTNIYANVEAQNELAKWRHNARANALYNAQDNSTDAERYIAYWESDRKLSERTWIFGAARYQNDRFSSIEQQFSITGGWGKRFIDRERQKFESTFGAGNKWFREQDSNDTDTEVIARYTGDYKLKTSANSNFRQQLLIEAGESNTFTESITSFTANINKKLATKITYNLQNNTNVPAGSKKTDTVTAVTLVYNIGS
jgi:putative salt-induced outer membrane protein